MLKSAGDFLYKHRGKLIAVTVIAIGAIAVNQYLCSSSSPQNCEEVFVEDDDDRLIASHRQVGKERTKQLVIKQMRVKSQLESSIQLFIPTLRAKIIDSIDIATTIRKIKLIRAQPESYSDPKQAEDEMWSEVKISSFLFLYISVYMNCIVITLLKLQLHIFERYYSRANLQNKKSNQNIFSSKELDGNSPLDSDEFKIIMEKTYGYLLSFGLQHFIETIRSKLLVDLKDWIVADKTRVEYSEFIQLMINLRKHIETDFQDLIPKIIIRKDLNEQSQTKGIVISKLLNETWDIVESPMYNSVIFEAVDNLFPKVFEDLKQNGFEDGTGFQSQSSSSLNGSGVNQRSPPLATLLPQLKSIALQMLPLDGQMTDELIKISTGPYFESLCLSLHSI